MVKHKGPPAKTDDIEVWFIHLFIGHFHLQYYLHVLLLQILILFCCFLGFFAPQIQIKWKDWEKIKREQEKLYLEGRGEKWEAMWGNSCQGAERSGGGREW